MTNIILIVILFLIATSAITYILRSKKRGQHCIGCPHAKQCKSKSCSGNSKPVQDL